MSHAARVYIKLSVPRSTKKQGLGSGVCNGVWIGRIPLEFIHVLFALFTLFSPSLFSWPKKLVLFSKAGMKL